MPARHTALLSLLLGLVLFLDLMQAPGAAARPVEPPRLRFAEPELPVPPAAACREDTLFLFAASGDGSFGSPGTDTRGFIFDGTGGAPEPAGWFSVDKSAQEGEWWHLSSTDVCAGTGTDMSQALPFDFPSDPSNDYALWCGRLEACGWEHETGYGNDWKQYAVVDLSGHTVTSDLTIRYAYRADFEGDIYDWFELRVDSAGTWKTMLHNNVTGEQSYQEIELPVSLEDLGGTPTETRVGFYFQTDGAWSDQDGLYYSNVGAVWLDNIGVDVDGVEVFAADFEDGLQPEGLIFETPPGTGSNAELRSFLFQEDMCLVNNTNAWAFWQEGHYTPGYPCPVIPYGPPHVDEVVQSPIIEVDSQGNPIVFGPDTHLWLHCWTYMDFPLNALIFPSGPGVAAQVQDQDCLGRFVTNDWWWDNSTGWALCAYNLTLEIQESAEGGTITGLAVRFGVIDMCEVWGDIYGDCTNHTPAPYYDNIRLMLIDRSAAEWHINRIHAFQDNFAELDGRVRMDIADDIAAGDYPELLIGDSTVVRLNMDPLGGIATAYNPEAGEMRPELYLWWRVAAGPHAGLIGAEQADPDASDGIFSPYAGTQLWDGENWGTMQADSAAWQGTVTPGKYAFDFADDYFEPGDLIEFFYRAEAEDGSFSLRPEWAMSDDPRLRDHYCVRCLPTAGTLMLYVEDGRSGLPAWQKAFRYNGYGDYDIYTTQAPSSGLDNGLAGRAELGQLAPYEVIVWDSGDLPEFTICTLADDKTEDDLLLADWLRNTGHGVRLWVMGNMVASDLGNGEPFLSQVLGVSHVGYHPYHDYTGIIVPRIFAIHPALEYLGEAPHFLLDGGCPSIESFDVVEAVGAMTKVTHEWEEDVSVDMVAGILNLDPDGDGTDLNDAGYPSRVLFNPFSYRYVLDEGYGLPAGTDYARLMVGHILTYLFEHLPDAVPVYVPGTPAFTRLAGAWPNPFNPSTTFRFSLARREHVHLIVYDVAGRQVRVLCDGPLAAGEQELAWDGRDGAGSAQASGVYLASFRAGRVKQELKLVLLK